MKNINDDPRIDSRIKAVMGAMPADPQGDVSSRQELLQETNQPEAVVMREQMMAMLDMMDSEIEQVFNVIPHSVFVLKMIGTDRADIVDV